ncbi:undecaprenyl-diphosphate phosphatase [Lignipirellula cremea]|uniref:Undecaprenyl-diphosphatase n=1 Tax=Lignipirellula cremea TaxID=2528010 RepID=A0A518DME5_9BACT|nr:undecaprenyl-diphosphate phosphatase [Lignipirellula cremea]QDU93009.1 Undecaprenyl-diphosphatase [Lignipirellula cremea]
MEPSLWKILVLAVVQGVTEFLPISSSGHLVIIASFLSTKENAIEIADLNIVLHLGTLLSILVFYFRRIVRLLNEDRRVAWLLILGTIPAAVIGLPIKMFFEGLLESRLLAGFMLIVTGWMLLWISRFQPGKGEYRKLSWLQTVLIGCSQALALLPGLSRSGSTITAGLRCGLSPEQAATFSFLLAIPAIGGAGVLELAKFVIKKEVATTPVSFLAIGALVAFGVGIFSLWWLMRWIEKGRLQWFAAWCIPLGVFIVGLELFGPAPVASSQVDPPRPQVSRVAEPHETRLASPQPHRSPGFQPVIAWLDSDR